ncbi:MAG: class I SAM-dependent methyltransferase [Elusimicrobia bacterium]|nr:class I SAM-dependent methyltransferase [Elusimicrobiota bacterium]
MVSRAQEASPFDAVARDYDRTFTFTTLGRMLRARVWEHLAEHFKAGERVLDLACGTGEDAVWLAQRGVRVAAADASGTMLDIARAKAARAGIAGGIEFRSLRIERLPAYASQQPPFSFDGAFSNFGGLNAVEDRTPVFEALFRLLKPGGKLILVVMGPCCPWEIAGNILRLEPRKAFRRWKKSAPAIIGGRALRVRYPSAAKLQKELSGNFRLIDAQSLGLWLPTTEFRGLAHQWPRLFAFLNRLEKSTASITRGWGDHSIVIAARKP